MNLEYNFLLMHKFQLSHREVAHITVGVPGRPDCIVDCVQESCLHRRKSKITKGCASLATNLTGLYCEI